MNGWFAIMTEPQRELTAASFLRAAGVESYCPMVREMRRRRMRGTHRFTIKPIIAAAFPRYIFGRASQTIFDLCRDTPSKIGRLWIVAANRHPITASDAVIDAIREMTETRQPIKLGAEVRLANGVPMTARIADIARLHSHGEVALLLKMLGAERTVTVPLQAIGAIADGKGRWITAAETV